MPGQPAYPLVEKAKDTYGLSNLPAEFGLLIKRDAGGKVIGATLKQPAAQGNLELMFGTPAPPAGLPGIEEVMHKYIEALGGEAALRRHWSRIVEMRVENPTQGVTGTIVIRGKAPMSEATETAIYAQKKRILLARDYFDGEQGGVENSLVSPTTKSANQIALARISADFYRVLDWKSLYKTAQVLGRNRVGQEDCYAVGLEPAAGSRFVLFLSTRTFLPVQQETVTSVPGLGPQPGIETYSDYRSVDGVQIPFRRTVVDPISGETIETVTRIRFNVSLPDRTFRSTSPQTP